MSEYVSSNQEQEMFSLGRIFMGSLMGFATICGIWLLTGLIEVLARMMG